MPEPTNAANPGADFPIDLRQLVNMFAWRDAAFRRQLLEDPGAALAELAARVGLDLPEYVEFRVVEDEPGVFTIPLAANPVGTSPAELTDHFAEPTIDDDAFGSGTFWTITAECFCDPTSTGGCPCTNTMYGTPCLSCSIADFCRETMLLEVLSE